MYNKVLLIGNLTADPEIRYTPSGAPVTTIRLACTEKFRSKSSTELKEETLFINCIVWGNQATSAHQYLKKAASALWKENWSSGNMKKTESGVGSQK